MKTQRPITSEASDDEHRVLKFRPRSPVHPPGRLGYPAYKAPGEDDQQEPNDLSRYERVRDEPDDFRRRGQDVSAAAAPLLRRRIRGARSRA